MPTLLENRHSKCSIDPGNTASTPVGSEDADPDGNLTKIVGGESSGKSKEMSYLIQWRQLLF